MCDIGTDTSKTKEMQKKQMRCNKKMNNTMMEDFTERTVDYMHPPIWIYTFVHFFYQSETQQDLNCER